jgi:hypothetical protein
LDQSGKLYNTHWVDSKRRGFVAQAIPSLSMRRFVAIVIIAALCHYILRSGGIWELIWFPVAAASPYAQVANVLSPQLEGVPMVIFIGAQGGTLLVHELQRHRRYPPCPTFPLLLGGGEG